jgi:hypothetical protein
MIWGHPESGSGEDRACERPFRKLVVLKEAVEMATSWRIGLLIGLAVLGGRTAAVAQEQAGTGPVDGSAAAAAPSAMSGRTAAVAQAQPGTGPVDGSAPATAATAAARRPADPSFNRVTSTRRVPASGAMVQEDPLRQYSAQAREAKSRSVTGSTRTQPPAAAVQPQRVQSRNYYPGMRVSRHPNANVPQVRRQQGMGMGVRMGTGMGGGARHSTSIRGAVPAGGAGRGR